ncbi:MAG: O-acetylhomoserine aminocarboxypropyltransferase/cysteine synthase, partial [Alistipes sp.]|nr:O-acetylhomoserine aminocarboxypropyltransferase/cysteine synthase [Alistipes sp.]
MSEKKLRFETLQIHGGYAPDQTLSRGLAIYPTAAYHFKSCDYAANLFELSEAGNIYTRIHNPTTANYENRVAALYGGVGALATSSGMSAILLTVTALAKAGENIVTSPYVYGGTHNQFTISLRNLGVEVRFAKDASAEAIEEVIDDKTRFIFVESMSNPGCIVADIEALAKVAHAHNMPLVV